MRGRKPVPTVLKILRGNPGKRTITRDEPSAPSLAPACPEELTDPRAQAEWARTIAPAIAIRQITATDRVLAIAHCELWAMWRQEFGKKQMKPARQTLQQLIKVDSELGLSPVSRARVSVRKDQGGSDAAELARILQIR